MSIAKTKASCGRDYTAIKPANLLNISLIKVGDEVRICKARRTFKKGYLPSWAEEVFTVTKRVPTRRPVCTIADYHGEELEGTFYEQEL